MPQKRKSEQEDGGRSSEIIRRLTAADSAANKQSEHPVAGSKPPDGSCQMISQSGLSVSPEEVDILYQMKNPIHGTLPDNFLEIMDEFSQELDALEFGEKVCYIYNPLVYAKETHEQFIRKYCQSSKKVLFLGMNPGPFGMAQNGVPFGERDHVVDWLKITGSVSKPASEHPKRRILGLDCPRKEVSGRRFWGLWKELCGTPLGFFRNGFVYNHCPLVFMSESGKNVTPPTLPAREREPLNKLCDEMLIKLLRLLDVEVVVGVGKFAEKRAKKVIASEGLDGIRVEVILHPSPANPQANKGWDVIVKKQLQEIRVLQYFVDL